MIPILGRFITTPRQDGRQSDLIITVTPHIVRSQGIDGDDHLAKFAGQAQAGQRQASRMSSSAPSLSRSVSGEMIAQQPLQGPPSGQGGQGAPPAPGQPVPASMTGVSPTRQRFRHPIRQSQWRIRAPRPGRRFSRSLIPPRPGRDRGSSTIESVASSGIVPRLMPRLRLRRRLRKVPFRAQHSTAISGTGSGRRQPASGRRAFPSQSAPQGSATPAGTPAEIDESGTGSCSSSRRADRRRRQGRPTSTAMPGELLVAQASKPAGEAGAASGERDQE
jgi:hypothetical protein